MQVLVEKYGREVILSDETISKIEGMHNEVAELGLEFVVAETLGDPDMIITLRTREDTSLYYRMRKGTTFGDKFVVVAVKFLTDESFVSTAYITERPIAGRVIWTK